MKAKLIVAALSAFALIGAVLCAGGCSADNGSAIRQVGIAAHRGYWNCDGGGYSHNSIASLKTAQEYGFWASELDLHLTTDEVIVVFHDNKAGGQRIDANPYSAIADFTLNNGEKIPTFDEYLQQAAKNPKVRLVVEFKKHPTPEQEDRLIELTVAKLKEYRLFDPERVVFISFSRHACDVVAETLPEFTNQYLDKNFSPDELAQTGINGVDYEYTVFYDHPDWYQQARDHGMSVNCWTVDGREDIENMVDLGVDVITTNYPELVRAILAEKGLQER